MLKCLLVPTVATVMVAVSGSVHAAFDPAMYSVGSSLTSFSSLNQSLDIASTPYNFPFQAGTFVRSGYVSTLGTVELSRTQLVTDVYTVTQASTFSQGASSITLNPGDMIWAYTITLVDASTQTVKSLSQFQVGGGAFAPGTDVMDGSVIKGRGVATPGVGVSSPLGGNAGDLEDLSGFGIPFASLDWSWDIATANQLLNSQTITMLMFTGAANIGNGFANMIGNPAQQGTGSDPVANGAPVLIPIAIPSPGAAGVLFGGFALLAGKRRR